jgi:hypothetical protein
MLLPYHIVRQLRIEISPFSNQLTMIGDLSTLAWGDFLLLRTAAAGTSDATMP